MPLVDAVVNAVGSIGIGNIKGVLRSTFLGKAANEISPNITKLVECYIKLKTNKT